MYEITCYSGYYYIIFKNSGKIAINKSFKTYDDAMFELKKIN